jgi:hypothetical protein
MNNLSENRMVFAKLTNGIANYRRKCALGYAPFGAHSSIEIRVWYIVENGNYSHHSLRWRRSCT